MERLVELIRKFLEIQSDGRLRSPELIAEDDRLMDGLQKRYQDFVLRSIGEQMNNPHTREQIKPAPYPSPSDTIHSELIGELDQIRKARNSRFAGQLCMSNRLAVEKIEAILCPTCGAAPGEKCELHSGDSRTEPHRERRLVAEDLLSS